ncbi:MAG TPA: DUF2017 family protein [Actinomycetota bacterium]|nr:DUF2017 family protein [Actinomycetota bacterium]
MPPARVKRIRGGRFALRISRVERDVLRSLPAQLRQLMTEHDAGANPDLRRLFPTAYPDDPEKAAEYDAMVRDDLVAERLAAIDVMERTIDSDRLSEEELLAWLSSINDLRLVLGTRLDVAEDLSELDVTPDDPRAESLALYAYLSVLEEDAVSALS